MDPIPELTPNPLADGTIKTIDTEVNKDAGVNKDADMERAKAELEALKNKNSAANSNNEVNPSLQRKSTVGSVGSPSKKPAVTLFTKPTESNKKVICNHNIDHMREVEMVKLDNLDTDEQEEKFKKIKSDVKEIKKLLKVQLQQIDRFSLDPKKEAQREKIEKLIQEIEKDSEKVVDYVLQGELYDYLKQLRIEQSIQLQDNIALASDVMIESDIVMVDSDMIFNQYVQMNSDEKLSNSLDILAIFLKSEKILYTEAKTYCEQQLNFLMLPAIFISALTTVLSMALSMYSFGDIIIATLTAINSFILAIISYLKLDAKSEAHKTSAYQFDKLQTKCEFGSGKVIFFNKGKLTKTPDINSYDKIFDLVDSIELKVSEIKDMNKFILPEKIRKKYPNLYGINIFSAVKGFLIIESTLKSELTQVVELLRGMRDEINEINKLDMSKREESHKNIIYSWNMNVKNKREIERQLINARENYMKLDRSIATDFNSKYNDSEWCDCCIWMKT